jgi:hypothetical protein
MPVARDESQRRVGRIGILVNAPCTAAMLRPKKEKPMKVRVDAIVAETATILDVSLLRHDPEFADLPRYNRMHLIMTCLARRKIARAEKFGGRKVRCWRPSRHLENNIGARGHGIPGELERIEAPIVISTLADDFSELLQANGQIIDEVASYVVRRFGMYASGLLEYRGKKNGLCWFERSLKLKRSGGRSREYDQLCREVGQGVHFGIA